jgi:hypothetical protein
MSHERLPPLGLTHVPRPTITNKAKKAKKAEKVLDFHRSIAAVRVDHWIMTGWGRGITGSRASRSASNTTLHRFHWTGWEAAIVVLVVPVPHVCSTTMVAGTELACWWRRRSPRLEWKRQDDDVEDNDDSEDRCDEHAPK